MGFQICAGSEDTRIRFHFGKGSHVGAAGIETLPAVFNDAVRVAKSVPETLGVSSDSLLIDRVMQHPATRGLVAQPPPPADFLRRRGSPCLANPSRSTGLLDSPLSWSIIRPIAMLGMAAALCGDGTSVSMSSCFNQSCQGTDSLFMLRRGGTLGKGVNQCQARYCCRTHCHELNAGRVLGSDVRNG